MERSWLQEQAALSRFDGFRGSESLSCVKPTAAPPPSSPATAARSVAPEAGQSVDVVFDPQDAAADWSGFAPRHCAGRRVHAGPAAHRESIARSEEHGISPADHAETQDSLTTRRRRLTEPAREEGIVLGGSAAPRPEERFTTCARAANLREPTPAEFKSEGCRYSTSSGKRHITPPYVQEHQHQQQQQSGMLDRTAAGGNLWAPPVGALPRQAASAPPPPPPPPSSSSLPPSSLPSSQGVSENFLIGYRARAPNGPGSFLRGLGRHVAESGAAVSPAAAAASAAASPTAAFASAAPSPSMCGNPYVSGYTGHQPRR